MEIIRVNENSMLKKGWVIVMEGLKSDFGTIYFKVCRVDEGGALCIPYKAVKDKKFKSLQDESSFYAKAKSIRVSSRSEVGIVGRHFTNLEKQSN